MSNIALVLDLSALRAPRDTAVVFGPQRLSYGALQARANRIANGLVAAGIRKGDRVAIHCPNRPEFVAAYYGILKAGGVAVPLSTYLKQPEVAYQLAWSEACALIAYQGEGFAEHVLPALAEAPGCKQLWTIAPPGVAPADEGLPFDRLVDGQDEHFETALAAPGDTASINFTSGTTGRPKGVEVAHGALLWQVMLNQGLAERAMSRSRLVVQPLFHLLTQVLALNLGLFSGEKLVLMERFEPGAAIDLIRREQVTYLGTVPSLLQALVRHEPISRAELECISRSLKLVTCGGALLAPDLAEAFERRFGVPIRQGYGLTETSVVSWQVPGDPMRRGSVGRPVPGVAMRLADGAGRPVAPGELGRILIRSGSLMKGYYRDPVATGQAMRDGWLDTGDVGRMDKDGYLFLVGRSDDMILRGSAKVFPAELEPVLEGHPAVAQAVVVGVPDKVWGQEVKAVIVLRDGAHVSQAELSDWARARIAEDKYPRLFEVRESLPLTGTGKVRKELLTKRMPVEAAVSA